MKPASWIAVLVGCCVLLLTPLAYGTPPDPSWIAGFWDEGDHDDVVYFAISAVGMPGVQASNAPPSAIVRGRPIERDPRAHVAARPSIAPTRAPPTA